MRDCTQLTQEERYQIEALLKMGHHQSEVAVVARLLDGRASVGLQDPSGNMVVVTEGEPRSGCRILEFREEAREVVLDCGHGRRPYKLGDTVFVKTST
jgi:hypothetical protein